MRKPFTLKAEIDSRQFLGRSRSRVVVIACGSTVGQRARQSRPNSSPARAFEDELETRHQDGAHVEIGDAGDSLANDAEIGEITVE